MKRLNVIDQIQIAKPCPASWDEMKGDEQVRHCSLCQRNVFNLGEMTQQEIHQLITDREGKFCARLYRREDGTVMTADCPKGLAKARRRFATLTLAAAAFLFTTAFSALRAFTHRDLGKNFDVRQVQPFKLISEWVEPTKPVTALPIAPLMGDIAAPIPTAGPKGSTAPGP